jgi:hypothetical protein
MWAARVSLALATGFALLATAVGLTLTRSPPTVAWSDQTPLKGSFLKTAHRVRACQDHEMLPAGVSAVRLSLYDAYGPRVTVKVLAAGRVLTGGVRGAGWIGESPTVPLRPVRQASPDTKVCFSLGRPGGLVAIDGSRTSGAGGLVSTTGGHALGGRMGVEYLMPGQRSWWSLAPSVARRMGLGHWPAGTWTVLPLMAMVATVIAGALWLAARELR